MFRDVAFQRGLVELARHGILMQVVTGDAACAGMGAEGGGRKDVLPRPLAGSMRVFAPQRLGHVNVTRADSEILEVFLVGGSEIGVKARFQGPGQRYDPVLVVLAIVDGDGALAEVEVFDAQAHALHDAQAGTVHEQGSKLPGVLEVGDNGAHFVACHDDRRAAATVGGGDVFEGEFLDAEDLFGEEGYGVEGLLLGGRGDVALQDQIVEVGGDAGGYRVARGLFEHRQTEAGEADVPMHIGLLCGIGETGEADGPAQRIGDAVNFSACFGQWAGKLGWRCREHSANLDGLAAKCAMVGFKQSGLVVQTLPVESVGPWNGEDFAGQDAHSADGLAELPVRKMCGAPEGIEKGVGAFGGSVAEGFVPGFRPADIVPACGGLDGEFGKALEEALACRGDALTGWIWFWLGGHGTHIACS